MGVSSTNDQAARIEPRLKMFQLAGLRIDGVVCRAHILDISRSGARVHCTTDLVRDQRVTLMVEQLQLLATVLWEDSHRVGLRFQLTLTDAQLQRIAALR